MNLKPFRGRLWPNAALREISTSPLEHSVRAELSYANTELLSCQNYSPLQMFSKHRGSCEALLFCAEQSTMQILSWRSALRVLFRARFFLQVLFILLKKTNIFIFHFNASVLLRKIIKKMQLVCFIFATPS